MRMFEITWNDTDRNPKIDGRFAFTLPAVSCEICRQSYGDLGLAYPATEVTNLQNVDEYRSVTPVPVPEFLRRRDLLSQQLGYPVDWCPGAAFGPFYGKSFGDLGDFAWAEWTPFISCVALEKLKAAGIALNTGPAVIRGLPSDVSYRALQIEPKKVFHPRTFEGVLTNSCSVCGRLSYRIPKHYVLDANAVDPSVPLLRIGEAPMRIVATEHFVAAVQQLNLSDIVFKEVQVAV
jgi:uncharacterized double-CXXCG motif protein